MLTGKKNKRFISGRLLKKIFSDIYTFPLWLIDTCYLKVGDSAEVITLLLNSQNMEANKFLNDISLNELLSKILPELAALNEDEKN